MPKTILEKPIGFLDRFDRKPGTEKETTHYCPGCGHGIVHKLIAEAMEDLGIIDRTVFVGPIGCAVFFYYYFSCSSVSTAHGRAPAVSTAISRLDPHAIIVDYQGDGDLAAIGTNNLIHAANRGERMAIFFVNNALYGMTGGQMAPTTLINQVTTTTPEGRHAETEGYPMRMAEMIATLQSPAYVARVSLHTPQHVMKARAAIRRSLKAQVEKKGFTLVEILSPCPTGWKVAPTEAVTWMEQYMLPYYELGVFKDELAQRAPKSDLMPIMDLGKVLHLLGLDEAEDVGWGGEPFMLPETRFKIAGFGGQGVLSLGAALAQLGAQQGYQVTWLPSYGPEMRGGTANCAVVIHQESIGSPVVDHPDVLVAMNQPSLDKFASTVRPGGILIYNSSLITDMPLREDVTILRIPATDIAKEVGNIRTANSVLLGAYMQQTGTFSVEQALHVFMRFFPKQSLIDINREALLQGMQAAEAQMSERRS